MADRKRTENVLSYDAFGRLLAERFAGLSKQLKKIGQFVLDHPVETALETAAEIAARLDVQPSSLIRFAQALDFDGFSDVQRIFRARLVEQLPGYSASYSERIEGLKSGAAKTAKGKSLLLEVFIEANSDALQSLSQEPSVAQLDQAAERISKAPNIHVLGLRRSFPVASYIFYSLRHMDMRVFLLDGTGGLLQEQACNIDAGDVLIVITFPDYSDEVLNIAKEARDRGATVIALTDRLVSPIVNHSDIYFLTDKIAVSGFRTVAATMCLAQALVIGSGLAHGSLDQSQFPQDEQP